jgi:hypothetical protein
LSSSDACLIDLLLAARDDMEDLTSDVAFERADGVEFGMSLGNTFCDIGLCRRIGSQAADSDDAISSLTLADPLGSNKAGSS